MGAIQVNEEMCSGCGVCVDYCPMDLLELHDGLPFVVEPQECLECGTCMETCPEGAIRLAVD